MALIDNARRAFHARLMSHVITVADSGVPSFADKDSEASKRISQKLVDILPHTLRPDVVTAQAKGAEFEEAVENFLASTFERLQILRPGSWLITREKSYIDSFHPYRGLQSLRGLKGKKELMKDPAIRDIVMADTYTVKPDIVIARYPESDDAINRNGVLISQNSATWAPIRASNQHDGPHPILHACVSCKYTIRSDRVQNVRAEAITMMRHRRGHLPHISAVTCEPLPSRLASIARGTGEIDCVYHAFLPELRRAARESVAHSHSEQLEDLEFLIEGGRIRDISDLPLDLAS